MYTENDIAKITGIQQGTHTSDTSADPSSVGDNSNNPADDSTPPADPSNNQDTPSADDSPTSEPAEEEEYIDITQLGVESYEELQERLQRYAELERENHELSEYKAGPKFASDRQKFLYDFASQVEGMELARARQLLEVASLDLTNTPDHRIRYEAFKLDPQLKNLSEDEIKVLFMEEEQKYGDPNDEVNPPTDGQRIRAKQATAAAREKLTGFLKEWESARPVQKTPQELAQEKAQYQQFVIKSLSGFDGIQLKLSATNEKGEKLESPMNFQLDEEQKAEILNATADPAGWWDSMIEELGIMSPESDTPDFQKLANLITQIKYGAALQSSAYQQGRAEALADHLKTARNVSDPGGANVAPPAPPKGDDKSQAAQAFMKTVGLI